MANNTENNFADGMFFNRNEKAPEFVIGSLAVVPEKFVAWLQNQPADEKGYVRLVINKAKSSGKPYVALDTWKPKQNSSEEIRIEDVPF